MIIAQSARLGLEPLSFEHIKGFHELNSDERVSRWSHRHPSPTIAASSALLQTRLPSRLEPYLENYAILILSTSQFIGIIGLPRKGEVGYGLIPAFWGGGYATEALKLFTKHYWESERVVQEDVLMAETEKVNLASEKVLAKAGWERGEFVEKAFEVDDLVDGGRVWKGATVWRAKRPEVES